MGQKICPEDHLWHHEANNSPVITEFFCCSYPSQYIQREHSLKQFKDNAKIIGSLYTTILHVLKNKGHARSPLVKRQHYYLISMDCDYA